MMYVQYIVYLCSTFHVIFHSVASIKIIKFINLCKSTLENNCSSVSPACVNKLAFITCLPFNVLACFYESLSIK